MSFQVQHLRDSEEVDLCVTGQVEGHLSGIIYNPAVVGDHVAARLMHLVFALETGVRILLYWEDKRGEHQLILPLEGRGTLDFSKYNGLRNPRKGDWTGALGITASCEIEAPRHFTITMELSKQRA